MPSLTVYIAPAGATVVGSTPSTAGHMWYSIQGTNSQTPMSYGFAPTEKWQHWPYAPGKVYQNDTKEYRSNNSETALQIFLIKKFHGFAVAHIKTSELFFEIIQTWKRKCTFLLIVKLVMSFPIQIGIP
jgi:hypothetical protein